MSRYIGCSSLIGDNTLNFTLGKNIKQLTKHRIYADAFANGLHFHESTAKFTSNGAL